MKIDFVVNGKSYQMDVDPMMRLIDLLRDKLGLMGVKEGCGEGECGACTVIMDHRAVHSCLILAPQIRGKEIITVEGLGDNGQLEKLQEAFVRNGAVQCGYCTPGMLLSAKALLKENPKPSEEEIRIAISGNLCRCSGYSQIVKAIKECSTNEN